MKGQTENTGRSTARTRVKDYFLSHKRQMAQILLAILVVCGSMIGQQVYAANPTVEFITGGMNSLKSFIKTIAIGICVIVAVFGGIILVLGFALDNPDCRSKGAKFLIGGLIILSVEVFIWIIVGSV